MLSSTQRLKDILERDGVVSAEQFKRAIEEQKKTGHDLGPILLRFKNITEDQLIVALSECLDIPIIGLSSFRMDPSVIKLIPKEMALSYRVVPLSLIGDQLTVAMADPMDIFAIDNIKAVTGKSLNTVLAMPKDIRSTIDRVYEDNTNQTMADILKDIKESEDVELVKNFSMDLDKRKIESITQEAPIITLTNTIVQQGVIAKASDIFIEPLENAMRVRFRVDGIIRESDRMSKLLHFPIISRIKVISNLDIAEHRLPQDGRFRIRMENGRDVDFRVNILPTVSGEKAVLRILDKNLDILDLNKLNFQPDSLGHLKECCQKPHGLILCCGPTGSGKTTTLYAILKHIDSPGRNIITVEDPVEFQVKGFNQVNIRPEVGLTFPVSLRSILRQDPDIILIGEVRDPETLDIAVKAALTGHLVLSSLHTTTAAGSITRMINMGIEPFLICSSVVVIVAQRLIRKVCLKCRETYTISEETAKQFKIHELVKEHNNIFYKARGCEKCFHSGYSGRLGITEILVMTSRIKEMVLSRSSELDVKTAARAQGMKTMREDAIIKACEGLTTLEEVVRLTNND